MTAHPSWVPARKYLGTSELGVTRLPSILVLEPITRVDKYAPPVGDGSKTAVGVDKGL